MNKWIFTGCFSLLLTAGFWVHSLTRVAHAQEDRPVADNDSGSFLSESIADGKNQGDRAAARTVRVPVIVNERLLRDLRPGEEVNLLARTWGHPGMVWSPRFTSLTITGITRKSHQDERVREIWFRTDQATASKLAPYTQQPSLTCVPVDVKNAHAYLTSIGVADSVPSDPHRVRETAMNRIHELRDLLSSEEGNQDDLLKELRDASSAYFDADLEIRRQDLEEIRSRLEELDGQLKHRTKSKNRILDLQMKVWENESNGLGFFDRDVLHDGDPRRQRSGEDELEELLHHDDPEDAVEFGGRASGLFGDDSDADDPLEVDPESDRVDDFGFGDDGDDGLEVDEADDLFGYLDPAEEDEEGDESDDQFDFGDGPAEDDDGPEGDDDSGDDELFQDA